MRRIDHFAQRTELEDLHDLSIEELIAAIDKVGPNPTPYHLFDEAIGKDDSKPRKDESGFFEDWFEE